MLFLGEVLACTRESEGNWTLLVEVEQILTALKCLLCLREQLLEIDGQSACTLRTYLPPLPLPPFCSRAANHKPSQSPGVMNRFQSMSSNDAQRLALVYSYIAIRVLSSIFLSATHVNQKQK